MKIKQLHSTHPLKKRETDVWLVFCSGSNEVELVASNLDDVPGLTVSKAYSAIGFEQIRASVFTPIPLGFRRVIIATNITESAITIDDLSGVFDTMMEKYNRTTSFGGTSLIQDTISKTSAKQRAGRTGRTRKGFCYRMMTEDLFNSLPETRPKEITRIPIDSIVIELFSLNIDPVELFEGGITKSRYEQSISLLEKLGMITFNPLKVNESGLFCTQVPFSVRLSSFLYTHVEELGRDPFSALVFVSFLEGVSSSYFRFKHKTPNQTDVEYQKQNSDYYIQYFEKYTGTNDGATLLNLFNDIFTTFGTSVVRQDKLMDYANERSLDGRSLFEAFQILKSGVTSLRTMEYEVKESLIHSEQFIEDSLPILENVFFDRLFTRQDETTYTQTLNNKTMFYQLNSQNPSPSSAKRVIGLITRETQIFKNVRREIVLFIPISEEGIVLPPVKVVPFSSKTLQFNPLPGFLIVDPDVARKELLNVL